MSLQGSSRSTPPTATGLSDRHKRLLAILVREYIEHGEPVASMWLATHGGLGVSSATVRNMLATLEAEGFVYQPHTSAGRVPTDLAYRTYVDTLLEARRRVHPVAEVEARLRRAGSVQEVLEDASHELSRASTHLGFALGPDQASTALRHIDFVPLGPTKVLVVLVSTGGQVTHKVVEVEETLSSAQLIEAANFLNAEFEGLPLIDIRARILARMAEDRTLYDALAKRALQLASTSLQDLDQHAAVFVHGTSSLLAAEESHVQIPLDTMKALLKMLEDRHRLVQLLTGYLDSHGLTIVIGTEHAAPDLQPFSLVASSYSDGQTTGTVGVIGPRRMKYSKTIAVVDSLSQAVTKVLIDHSS